jgi:hypothetical protein
MDALRIYETFENIYQPTQSHIPEDYNLHTYSRDNFSSEDGNTQKSRNVRERNGGIATVA